MRMWSRRRFLLALASGAAVLGGAILIGQVGNYALDDQTRRTLRVLSVKQYLILRAAARRLLAADVVGAPTADEIGVPAYIDAWLVDAAPQVRQDFVRLLGVVEHGTPLWS